MFTVHRHGSLIASGVMLYAFTSCVAGFMSGRMYRQLQGEYWTWNIILTANLFTIPFFVIWCIINSFAWAHGTTQALPYTTVLILAFMWLFGIKIKISFDKKNKIFSFSWISIDSRRWNIRKKLFIKF
jgi:transmembrane 9 superfamily protein 1